jgi:hypothetical protein
VDGSLGDAVAKDRGKRGDDEAEIALRRRSRPGRLDSDDPALVHRRSEYSTPATAYVAEVVEETVTVRTPLELRGLFMALARTVPISSGMCKSTMKLWNLP